ncbi:hypothetical protein GFB49_03535 [Epibacterium sp. SM1979]|uniref:ABM domain-containing protein n=1 Tax=Tritonibacter litoralis TaxID=2662264 RepID=A0A843Y9C9_9RHOB|nr:hypothetical protein [Tritonibacter litoralis]MQQ07516.1 hypothetical protein [Tritonibacter litoralis]
MTQTVVETVTFELAESATEQELLTRIKSTEAFVRALPGFIFRRLSCGADGRWSDCVVWQDMASATAAAKAFEAQPFVPDLMATMKPGSVQMRHESVAWTMDATHRDAS